MPSSTTKKSGSGSRVLGFETVGHGLVEAKAGWAGELLGSSLPVVASGDLVASTRAPHRGSGL